MKNIWIQVKGSLAPYFPKVKDRQSRAFNNFIVQEQQHDTMDEPGFANQDNVSPLLTLEAT